MADLDLVPDKTDLEVFSNTDNVIEFQLLDATDPDNPVPIDITNDDVQFVARDTEEGEDIKISTKTNTVGEHSTPASGKTQFHLTKSELSLTIPTQSETWRYEVRRIIAGSNYEVIYIWGDILVKPQVGQSA